MKCRLQAAVASSGNVLGPNSGDVAAPNVGRSRRSRSPLSRSATASSNPSPGLARWPLHRPWRRVVRDTSLRPAAMPHTISRLRPPARRANGLTERERWSLPDTPTASRWRPTERSMSSTPGGTRFSVGCPRADSRSSPATVELDSPVTAGPPPVHSIEIQTNSGIFVAGDGAVYFSDSGNGRVREVAPNGIITTRRRRWDGADSRRPPSPRSKPPLARDAPAGLAIGPDGDLYIGAGSVYRLTAEGTLQWVVGEPENIPPPAGWGRCLQQPGDRTGLLPGDQARIRWKGRSARCRWWWLWPLREDSLRRPRLRRELPWRRLLGIVGRVGQR